MMIQYLSSFYEKKKIKEISILEERIEEEEKYIYSKTNAATYE